MQSLSIDRPPGALCRRPGFGKAGITLIEVLVSICILALTSCGGVAAFTMLNRYASTLRNTSSAKALCQERIEQAMSLPFNPPSTIAIVSAQQTAYGPYNLLGAATDWTTVSAPYSAGTPVSYTGTSSGLQTSSEPVNVYVQQDGTTATVTGTRTTTVTSMIATLPSSPNVQVPSVLFTVQVTYIFRGNANTYSMSTVRSFDFPH